MRHTLAACRCVCAVLFAIGSAAADERIHLHGAVIDQNGLPVVLQRVAGFYDKPVGDEPFFEAVTGMDGSFELDLQPASGTIAFLNRERKIGGFAEFDGQHKSVTINAVSLVDAHGRLVDGDGRPVADQLLRCCWLQISPPEVVTDEKGEFFLPHVLPDVECTINLPGRTIDGGARGQRPSPSKILLRFRAKHEETTELGDVKLQNGIIDKDAIKLVGKVIDADGKPVEKLAVHFVFNQTARRAALAGTSKQGTFEISRPPTPAVIWLRTGDAMFGCYQQIDEAQTEILLKLEPLAAAHGRLLDGAGSPVGDADVVCETWSPNVATPIRAKTAADGTFTIHCLFPRHQYDVKRILGGKTSPTLKRVKPKQAETIEVGDVSLPAEPGTAK